MILCINKCGPFLERIQEELFTRTGKIDGQNSEKSDDASTILKKRFAEKLNEYYENTGLGIRVDLDDIIFTDWVIGDSQSSAVRDFGLCGVGDVKRRIKQYLLKYGIYHETEEHELQRCLSPLILTQ